MYTSAVKNDTVMRKAIPTVTQELVLTIADRLLGISKSTVCVVSKDVCSAICFKAVDGSHIPIVSQECPAVYYNRKGWYSARTIEVVSLIHDAHVFAIITFCLYILVGLGDPTFYIGSRKHTQII